MKLLRARDVVDALVLIVFLIFSSLMISTTFAETWLAAASNRLIGDKPADMA